MAELGRCYLNGLGAHVNLARGEELLRAAAEAGWKPALGELERYWYERAEAFMHGEGLAPDAEKAVVLYRKAGELGHRRAALMLGHCHRYGWGTAADMAQAVLWYRQAITLFDAKVALGDLYYEGAGVEQNYREAWRWYEQALAQHEDAYVSYCVGFCLLHGQGVKRDVRRALTHLRRAASQGDANAQYELGSVLYQGLAGEPNARQALRWLRQAAALGHEGARGFVERLEKGRKLN
jgi:hypothetical protein